MDRLALSLSNASGVPYYRQIVDQVTRFIRTGQLEPNARLPSVRDLANQLLVSLITVRRSYAELEAQGLIVRRQGQGTFVAEEVDTASRDQAFKEARKALEEATTFSAGLGLKESQIRKLVDELLHRMGEDHDIG